MVLDYIAPKEEEWIACFQQCFSLALIAFHWSAKTTPRKELREDVNIRSFYVLLFHTVAPEIKKEKARHSRRVHRWVAIIKKAFPQICQIRFGIIFLNDTFLPMSLERNDRQLRRWQSQGLFGFPFFSFVKIENSSNNVPF